MMKVGGAHNKMGVTQTIDNNYLTARKVIIYAQTHVIIPLASSLASIWIPSLLFQDPEDFRKDCL